ncbi:MAG: Spy/CpxP family protein refolding chaperone [Salinivirgaceae bacterium]
MNYLKAKLLVFSLILALAVSAQPLQKGQKNYQGEYKTQKEFKKEPFEGHLKGFLNLTDEQQSALKNLQVTHQKEMLPLRNELGEKKAKMRTLQTAENVDLKAINALIDEMSMIKTKMAKAKAAKHQAIRKLLTEEQRLQFDLHYSKKGMHYLKGNSF